MIKKRSKHTQRTFVKQRYQADCGVACLLSVIQYYDGCESLERLRELSGTNAQGTTLLGLYQTAINFGFDAKGVKSDIDSLKEYNIPVILHLIIEEKYNHFVICYEYDKIKGFLIGDPAKDVSYLSENELNKLWKEQNCLILQPNNNFLTTKRVNQQKIKLFIQLIKDDSRYLISNIAIGVAIAFLGLTMSVFSQKLIDNILPSHDRQKLLTSIILLTIILLLRIGFIVVREYLNINQTKSFNTRINGYFYNNLINLQKIFFDNRKVGELTARLNDTHRVQDVVRIIVNSSILDFMICVVSIILLSFYSFKILIIILASLPIYFYLIYRNRHKIIESQRNIMQSYALNESNYISSMQGIIEIKNNNKQDFFLGKNKTIFGEFQEKIYHIGLINIRVSWQAGFAGIVFLIAILTYSSISVLNNQLKLGELMAVIGISSSLLPSIGNLALVFIPINEAKVAFERMFDIVSIDKEKSEGVEIDEINQIDLSKISFRFAGRQTLFHDASMNLKKGRITALVGESGCGKTTFANILQKFYTWENGIIIINGNIELQNISIESWRKIVGVMPQEIYIFNGNLLYNITMEENADQTLINNMIYEYGLSDFIKGFPNDLMTLVGEEGINLSGGQKRIIGLLRVLYRNPQFYILDEPTSSLDVITEKIVIKILKTIKKNSVILLITHDLSLVNSISHTTYELNKTLIKK